MRVLPAGFVSFRESGNKQNISNTEFNHVYTVDEISHAKRLADEAMDYDIGRLTIGFINQAQGGKTDDVMSAEIVRLAQHVENFIAFKEDIKEAVKEYNAGARGSIKHWKRGKISTFVDDSSREYLCLYKDSDNRAYSISLNDTAFEKKQYGNINVNYDDNTFGYEFFDYNLEDGGSAYVLLYSDMNNDDIISMSVAKCWNEDAVRYSFKNNEPYMAAYNTQEGRSLFYFNEDGKVQKIVYQKYNKALGALELGAPETFVKTLNGDFVSLGCL